MLQPETLAPSLFNRLERFFQQDKIDFFKINSLKRDAKQLMNVSPILAYTALGMISALENKRDEVLSYYKTVKQIGAEFEHHQYFMIALNHIFDFEQAKMAMQAVIQTCNRSNIEHLIIAKNDAIQFMLLSSAKELDNYLIKLRPNSHMDSFLAQWHKFNIDESVLQNLILGIYSLLANYGIHVTGGNFNQNNENYWLNYLFVNGCNDMKQLAQIQQEVNLYLANFEEEHHIDLSALSFALRLYQEPA